MFYNPQLLNVSNDLDLFNAYCDFARGLALDGQIAFKDMVKHTMIFRFLTEKSYAQLCDIFERKNKDINEQGIIKTYSMSSWKMDEIEKAT